MGTGYVRIDTSNNIADGGVIDASDLDGEFNALVESFSETAGHTHDGSTAEGAPITVLGPAQEFVGDASGLFPKTTNTYTLGKAGATFSNVFAEVVTLADGAITATAAEINKLAGATASTAELNLLAGQDQTLATSDSVTFVNITVTGTVDGRDVATDGTKLDAIETSATADQTAAQIKTAYEGETNAFTDAQFTKLSNIETGATADQTGAQIKAAYEGEANAFTDTQFTKLGNVEDGATADQTGAQIKTAYESESNAFTDTLFTKLGTIETNADVTDTANVAAAGALMDSEVTNLAAVKAFDTTDYATATQGGTADSALQPDGDGSALTGIVAGLAWARKTSNYTSANNDAILADTSGGAWTLTLPSSPGVGDLVRVLDGADWATNNLTVARNGSTVEGDAANLVMNIGGVSVDFVYDGSTWQIYAQVGVSSGTVVTESGTQTLTNKTLDAPSFSNAVFTGDGSSLTGVDAFKLVEVSGATPSLDVATYNFFDQSALTADTTVSFASVPTNAKWQYSYVAAVDVNAVFDLADASYANKSFSVASQDTLPVGLAFNTDGTSMFMLGLNNDTVYQYTLSTGFDVSTASYASKSFSVSSQESNPTGLAFNTDGTSMFIVGSANDTVFQYTLSTAFDVSTASYASKSFSVASQENNPQALAFNTDGTSMLILGTASDTVYQYTLSTGFDVSTASYANKSFSVASQDTGPTGLAFNTDGTSMFIVGFVNDTVFQYTLSTGFDVSTASYANKSFSVSSHEDNPLALTFNTDGTSMFIVGTASDTVFQYNLASAYSLTLPTVVGTPSATVTGDRVTYTFFTKDSGTTVNLISEEII